MSAPSTYLEAQHAAQIAIAGMALRALFDTERANVPEVVSLRFSVSSDGPGVTVIECEAVAEGGLAIGGWSL